jgi:hypothetical protein
MTDKLTQAMALLDDVASGISATDAYQRGRISERLMIVAWLRDQKAVSNFYIDHVEAASAAICIETGEHLT